jgi:hypothetical protein
MLSVAGVMTLSPTLMKPQGTRMLVLMISGKALQLQKKQKDGSIMAAFERQGTVKHTYSTRNHTYIEIW